MYRNRWRFVSAVGLFVVLSTGCGPSPESVGAAESAGRVGCAQVRAAFTGRQSGQWLTMRGQVSQLLPDSHGASTHQRFILACPDGQTVLVANNIDVGQRVPLSVQSTVVVHGQFIWNSLGGLIHDTHHSTDSNPDGWILSGGSVYQ